MEEFAQGWVDDPDEVLGVAQDLRYPVFGDTPAGDIAEDKLPENAYLWDAARKVLGGLLPPRNQLKVGSCVAFGTARAVEYTMLCEIARGEPESYLDLAEEVIYGGSRVEVGGGKIRGDGSIGAWAARWVRDWGLVNRGIHAGIDLREYNETRCRQYGSTGVPSDLEFIAKQFPVRTITQVKTTLDARKALAQGYGISICSMVGFEMTRNAKGISQRSGKWAHCMCVAGYATIDGKMFYRIDNSWGANAHRGPVGPGNPGPEGFYCDEQTMADILGQNDSWAFSAVQGFPKKPTIDFWLI